MKREDLLKLAREIPKLRKHLIPLLKQADHNKSDVAPTEEGAKKLFEQYLDSLVDRHNTTKKWYDFYEKPKDKPVKAPGAKVRLDKDISAQDKDGNKVNIPKGTELEYVRVREQDPSQYRFLYNNKKIDVPASVAESFFKGSEPKPPVVKIQEPTSKATGSIWDRTSLQKNDFVSLGKTPAGNISTHTPSMFKDKVTGEKFLVKKAPIHSMKGELIGQRLFEAAELPAPKLKMLPVEGDTSLLMEYLQGYEDSDGNILPSGFEHNDDMKKGFFIDLLAYNYDRAPWNMMYKDKDFMFIDFGASIMSRAQGETKGFPTNVDQKQVESVWKNNPSFYGTVVNKAYANLIKSPKEKAEGVKILDKITDKVIDKIVDETYDAAGDKTWTQAPSSSGENPKYASYSDTVKEIIKDGGSERKYVKRALKSRRDQIKEKIKSGEI